MTYRFFDAGEGVREEPRKEARDCQVRALCTALGVDYAVAWEMLYAMQKDRMACAFELMKELDAEHPLLRVARKLSFPAKRGKTRMTPARFCREYKLGSYILRMAHHVATVREGVLFDTWNSSDRCREGVLFDTWNSSDRCVYSAWEIMPWEKTFKEI